MRSMLRLGMLLVAVSVMSCSAPSQGSDAGAGGHGGGSGGGTAISPFQVSDLDPDAVDATYFAMAVDPSQERVGVAYYSRNGNETQAGIPDYDIKYVEWKQGVVSPIQTLRYVQRLAGLALVFEPGTGNPIVSYLGGAEGFEPGQSIYWFQSDAVINRRQGTTWTETAVATSGDQVTCGNAVSDRGFLVGIWPAMAFDSAGKFYLAYRDGHSGQFGRESWGASDVEVWGGALPPTQGQCVMAGGNNKDGWGGHIQLAAGPGNEMGIIYDQMQETPDQEGRNVLFHIRDGATGTWSAPQLVFDVANTQTGAALAYDEQEGYGIAVLERSINRLLYSHRVSGVWTEATPVYGSGAGGWYPSLAMDPIHHEPAIAFYVCGPKGSETETSCLTRDDKLVVSQRVAGTWRETLVDTNGGYHPKVGFLASGKRVVVYRTPPAIDAETNLTVAHVGALKIAVEQ